MTQPGKIRGLLLFLFLAACTPSRPASPTLAIVNGEKVSREDFERFAQSEQWKFGEQVEAPAEPLLDQFLRNRLLLAEAKRRGVAVSPSEVAGKIASLREHYPRSEDFEELLTAKGTTLKDFEARQTEDLTIQKLVEQVTQEAVQVDPAEVSAYYETHLTEFDHPEQVHPRQIVTDSREKALALREMLLNGASFEETALKYSLSPDRKKGGDLGWFERAVMPKEFEDVCFYLPPGRLSPVVKTPYGYHLFEVLDKRPAGRFTFEEVRSEIEEKLKTAQGREAFVAWFEKLRAEAKIKVYAGTIQKVK